MLERGAETASLGCPSRERGQEYGGGERPSVRTRKGRAQVRQVAAGRMQRLVVAYTAHLMWLQREIPTEVIISWMGATTAEIIGILWVIARSLFPFRDEHRSTDLEKSGGGRIGHPKR